MENLLGYKYPTNCEKLVVDYPNDRLIFFECQLDLAKIVDIKYNGLYEGEPIVQITFAEGDTIRVRGSEKEWKTKWCKRGRPIGMPVIRRTKELKTSVLFFSSDMNTYSCHQMSLDLSSIQASWARCIGDGCGVWVTLKSGHQMLVEMEWREWEKIIAG
jgi:hypothetical protein